jgi:hypothetical protein
LSIIIFTLILVSLIISMPRTVPTFTRSNAHYYLTVNHSH